MLEEYLIRSRTRDGLFVVAMTAIFFDTNKLFRAGKKKLVLHKEIKRETYRRRGRQKVVQPAGE